MFRTGLRAIVAVLRWASALVTRRGPRPIRSSPDVVHPTRADLPKAALALANVESTLSHRESADVPDAEHPVPRIVSMSNPAGVDSEAAVMLEAPLRACEFETEENCCADQSPLEPLSPEHAPSQDSAVGEESRIELSVLDTAEESLSLRTPDVTMSTEYEVEKRFSAEGPEQLGEAVVPQESVGARDVDALVNAPGTTDSLPKPYELHSEVPLVPEVAPVQETGLATTDGSTSFPALTNDSVAFAESLDHEPLFGTQGTPTEGDGPRTALVDSGRERKPQSSTVPDARNELEEQDARDLGQQEPARTAHPKSSSRPEQRSAGERSRTARMSPDEASRPFGGVVAGTPSPEYALWNKAIVLNSLQMYASGDEVYLTITPRILAGALAEVEGVFLSPEDASTRFINSVSAMYKSRVLPHPEKLQILRRCGEDGLPECAGFLALCVLAAYRMRTEEDLAATAYYRRLEELLGCGMSGGMPRGFDGDDFEAVWLFLCGWLRQEHGRQLAMPRADVGLRRFVALPLTHVPLRQVDIERLPDVFDWAGYEPGERIAIDRMSATLAQWTRARGGFTVAGLEALGDDRRAAVLAQIAHEVECWDGSLTDASGRRTASVEIFLHWERRLPVLSYLPRRPAGFPTTFDDGEHVLDAGQEGWYEPLPMDVGDGIALRDGFSWQSEADNIHFVLRRIAADVIAMAPSEFDGPVSHGSLVFGLPGAVMCTDAVAVRVVQYLESVTGRRCAPVNAPGVPTGWRLIIGVNPIYRVQPPEGLEVLDAAANVEIIPRGGLRLGRRWAWLNSAPPTLIASGVQATEPVLIDEEPVQVDQDGIIQDEGRLTRPGVHVVQVGRIRRRLEILVPELPAGVRDGDKQGARPWSVVALPTGSWTILGARPDEIAHATSGRWGHGSLASCAFEPIWAVSFAGGRGATVRLLRDPVTPPVALERRSPLKALRRAREWADAVYGAHIRRPTFYSGAASTHSRAPLDWIAYVNAAREIKRALRAGRR